MRHMVQPGRFNAAGHRANQRQRGRLRADDREPAGASQHRRLDTSKLPNFVGVTFKPNAKMTVGAAAILTTNSWTQETDSQLITPTASGAERFAYSGN